MVSLLSRLFIKNRTDYKSPAVRSAYGFLCSILGIVLNILLFAGKYFAGTVSGSIAITADAFNNLSDAASSLITLFGFKLADKKPNPDHPFGHGRFEYVSGFVVSVLILLMGFEVGKSALSKIISPEKSEFSVLSAVILGVSILVKLYMFLYNKSFGKKVSSAAMQATAFDSLSDTASTAVVLISSVLSLFIDFNFDGFCGLAVSLFIFWSGIKSAKETLAPLLGQPPSPEFVRDVEDIIMSHPEIIGLHDMVVHDYGPGRVMLSVHAEVPGNRDIYELHDAIDHIEHELDRKLSCSSVIHLDPIDTENPILHELKEYLTELVSGIDEKLSFHDLRIVPGPTHTNVIFDLVVPLNSKQSNNELADTIRHGISERFGENYFCVIQFDRSYI